MDRTRSTNTCTGAPAVAPPPGPPPSARPAPTDPVRLRAVVQRAWDVLVAVAVPLAVGGFAVAPGLVALTAGSGFAGAVTPLRLLLVAGALIGYGAKLAGGCTSGNGLTGSSMLAPGSLVATATFFSTAIVVTFAIEAVI